MIPCGRAGSHGWLQSDPHPVVALDESVPLSCLPPPPSPLSVLFPPPPVSGGGFPASVLVVPLPPHEQPWLSAPTTTPTPRAMAAAWALWLRRGLRLRLRVLPALRSSNGVEAARALVRRTRRMPTTSARPTKSRIIEPCPPRVVFVPGVEQPQAPATAVASLRPRMSATSLVATLPASSRTSAPRELPPPGAAMLANVESGCHSDHSPATPAESVTRVRATRLTVSLT